MPPTPQHLRARLRDRLARLQGKRADLEAEIRSVQQQIAVLTAQIGDGVLTLGEEPPDVGTLFQRRRRSEAA